MLLGFWVADRLGGFRLGPLRNNGGFCAAGENFSKNDQHQWKMTEKNIFMGLFDIILVKYSS